MRLKRALGQLVLIRILILSILFGTSVWSFFEQSNSASATPNNLWLVGLTYLVSLINLLALRFSPRLVAVGYVQLLTDVVLSSFAIYITGSAVGISLYLLVIVGAAVIFNRNGAVAIAAFAGVNYALLASGIPPFVAGSAVLAGPQQIFEVYISLIVIALVSGYLARQLEEVKSIAESHERNLTELSTQKQQIFDDVSEGIITLDLSSRITGINMAAQSIIGLREVDSSSVVGNKLDELLKTYGIDGINEVVEAEDPTHTPKEILLRGRNLDQERRLSYSVRPLIDSGGEQTGRILFFNDVSHIRSIEEQLSLHERMTKLLADNAESTAVARPKFENVRMVGESPLMQRVFSLVERIAQSDVSVLISGESGTGKELIAKAIYSNCSRRNKPFVAINCGAIPENLIESELFGHKKGSFTGAVQDSPGLFRQANGGTVFLDEIGELPLHLQTSLLRVLQEKRVRSVGDVRDHVIDVRVIAATNKDLKQAIKEGHFREDLYYRLNVLNIMLPPLRERREDIPFLVRHFIGQFCKPDQILPKISPEALQLLMSYPFPGNIRELENIIERALVLGGQAILAEHLPDEVRQATERSSGFSEDMAETEIRILPVDLEGELARIEREYLTLALDQSGGIKKQAAEMLGLNFRSFRYRLKKYELSDGDPIK